MLVCIFVDDISSKTIRLWLRNAVQTALIKTNTFFSKIINLCLRDINFYPINNKTDYFLEKYIFNRKKKKQKKVCIFLDSRSYSEQDPVPDPLFHATDPRIRIHIKMKRIRNSLIKCIINYYETH